MFNTPPPASKSGSTSSSPACLTDEVFFGPLKRLNAATSLEDMLKITAGVIERMGFEWGAYHVYPTASLGGKQPLPEFYGHHVPQGWLDTYLETFLDPEDTRFQHDPIIHYALDTGKSFSFSSLQDSAEYREFDPDLTHLHSVLENLGDGLGTATSTSSLNRSYACAGVSKGRLQDYTPLLLQFRALCETLDRDYHRLKKRYFRDIALTPREHQVLVLISDGKSNPDIAAILGISSNTVSSYVKRLHLKFGTHDKVSLALKAVALGKLDKTAVRRLP